MKSLIDTQFAPLFERECWGVHWDADTGLRMDFGPPYLEIWQPKLGPPGPGLAGDSPMYRHVFAKGEWRLWIGGHWKLTLADGRVARGTSEYRDLLMALARLDGQRLCLVDVNPETGATRFSFDLGAILEVRRVSRGDGYEIWALHRPDGMEFRISGMGCYAIENAESADSNWIPLERRA